jgi:hypothetical protein
MALASLTLVDGLRLGFEWVLEVLGFWKLLVALAVLYGLHITHVVLLRVVDGFFGSNFFGILPGVTSIFWQVVQGVVAVSIGRFASWSFPSAHTELPSMSALEDLSVNGGGDTGWQVFSKLDGLSHSAFAVTFMLQIVRALRR